MTAEFEQSALLVVFGTFGLAGVAALIAPHLKSLGWFVTPDQLAEEIQASEAKTNERLAAIEKKHEERSKDIYSKFDSLSDKFVDRREVDGRLTRIESSIDNLGKKIDSFIAELLNKRNG